MAVRRRASGMMRRGVQDRILRFALVALLTVPVAAAVSTAGASAPHGPAASPGTPSWTLVLPKSPPGARDQAAMAYDPLLREVILFGGYNFTYFDYNDTWAYHAGVWTDLTPNLTVSPPARWSPSLAYDPALKGVLLFGGRTFTKYFNDTWLYNSTGWHRMAPPHAPAPRSAAGLAWDPLRHEMILYGGWIGNLYPHPTTYFSDTWALHGHQWTNLTASLSATPGARGWPDLAYDGRTKQLVEFGGLENYANGTTAWVGTTWVLGALGWSALSTASAPAVGSENGGMSYYTAGHSLVQFGSGRPAPFGNETWVFHSGAWKNQTARLSTAPSARGIAAMADDVSDGCVLLFGGDTGSSGPYGYAGDTWEYR